VCRDKIISISYYDEKCNSGEIFCNKLLTAGVILLKQSSEEGKRRR